MATKYPVLSQLRHSGQAYGPKSITNENPKGAIDASDLTEDEIAQLQDAGVLGEAFEVEDAPAAPASKGKSKAQDTTTQADTQTAGGDQPPADK